MTLSPGQGLPEHAHRHQGTVSPPLHTCFHQVSPQDKGPKLWALQATGLHVEIKEEFIAPTLALFFSDIQSFGLSQIQIVLGCLVTEGHCFAAGFGRRTILYHKARKIVLISVGVSSGQLLYWL